MKEKYSVFFILSNLVLATFAAVGLVFSLNVLNIHLNRYYKATHAQESINRLDQRIDRVYYGLQKVAYSIGVECKENCYPDGMWSEKCEYSCEKRPSIITTPIIIDNQEIPIFLNYGFARGWSE